MPTLGADVYSSTLTRGVNDIFNERAFRVVPVSELTNDVNTLNEAVQFFLDSQSNLFHPVRTNLPLARVTATRRGPTKAWIRAEYFRKRGYVSFTDPSFALAKFSSDVRNVEWVRDTSVFTDGRPDGEIHFHFNGTAGDPGSNPNAVPRYWTWKQACVRIQVETLLATNEVGNIAGRVNKINQNAITMGNFNFPAFTVLFAGYDITPIEQTDGSFQYFTRYLFQAVNGEYRRQHAFFAIGPGAWTTIDVFEYEAASFAGFAV